MRIRVDMLVVLGLIVAVFAAFTWACYALASLLGGLFRGGESVANVVMLPVLAVLTLAALLLVAERKWSAFTQDRIGPNRARLAIPGLSRFAIGGIPHLVADAIKILTKEDNTPARAGKLLFNLAPMLFFAPVACLFVIVPVAPAAPLFGRTVALQGASLDAGLLFLFAIASLSVFGIALAGWSSNNKMGLIGSLRASSQMVSYEVALGLSLVGLVVAFSRFGAPGIPADAFNSLRLEHLIGAQSVYLWSASLGGFDLGLPAWGVLLQPLGFLLFFAAAFAETKRAPFDLPEADSEIVGYFLEYSGMRFGMFLIGEFVEVVALAGVTTAVFFGGYHLPFGEQWLAAHVSPIALGVILGTTFWVKVLLLCWLQLIIRWTFPRFRYDQVQRLGWRILLPLGLANVFVSGALVLLDPSLKALAVLGMIEIATIAVATASTRAKESEPAHGAASHAAGH